MGILGICGHRHAYMMAVMLSMAGVGLMLILNYEDFLLRFFVFEDLLWVVLGLMDISMLLLVLDLMVRAVILLVLFDDMGLVAVVVIFA